MQFITEDEVRKLLKNLSSSKSTAIDGLNNYALKLGADVICGPFHNA